MRRITGEEDSSDPPAVGESDVMAVARVADDLNVRSCNTLAAEHVPDGVLAEEVVFVLLSAHRELPAMVSQRG